MVDAYTASGTQTSPIRRITEGRRRWRVLVETWRESDTFQGRLLFHADDAASLVTTRESAVLLCGGSREDVVSLAHDLPEDRLRRVLYSLG
jgi:hypothetical protein